MMPKEMEGSYLNLAGGATLSWANRNNKFELRLVLVVVGGVGCEWSGEDEGCFRVGLVEGELEGIHGGQISVLFNFE